MRIADRPVRPGDDGREHAVSGFTSYLYVLYFPFSGFSSTFAFDHSTLCSPSS